MNALALTVKDIKAERILVMSPHPDDESLGCGGLISLLAHAGRAIHVVFATEGGASHPNSQDWPRARLAAQRESEAHAALTILGVKTHARNFLRLPDGEMPTISDKAGKEAVQGLATITSNFEPELVLLPWRRDPSWDHRQTWHLTHAALAASGQQPDMLEYTIWLEEAGEAEDYPRADEVKRVGVDITPVLATKRAAVFAHLSQTTDLIEDDPTGFCLSAGTIDRLCGPTEYYWKPL